MAVAEMAGPAADKLARVREILAEKPDSVVEIVAREVGVPSRVVLEETPADQRVAIGAEHFEAVWQDLASWGTVLFLLHTPDIVLECEGSLPVGSFGHGYYNIHGDSPIGGHIKASNCQAIYLVDKRSSSRRSCSVQFFNGQGETMFKVFVRRDKSREMLADQLAAFEALKARFA